MLNMSVIYAKKIIQILVGVDHKVMILVWIQEAINFYLCFSVQNLSCKYNVTCQNHKRL